MPKRTTRRVLIIVENLPVPFDKRVWNEATALKNAGYVVSVICPTAKGYERRFELLDDVAIYRHPLPAEGNGALGYAVEYSTALFWEFLLAWRVFLTRGFDVIQACNPPDTIFLVALGFRLFGKRFVFDHHDINPELYRAKFGRMDFFYRIIVLLERLTFKCASISLATNESYKEIAVQRGGMEPERVFVVRSGPNLKRFQPVAPRPDLKQGRRYLVGYVGVMGKQEGLDYLLQAAHWLRFERQREDILFVLVGAGTELPALREEAKEKNLDGTVIFTGRISDEELLAYLSTADVCVNPDVANEMNDKSTMNKIMEYMAVGKPIVQFDLVEGRRSALDASLYALRNDAKDLAEKILALLEDPARARAMGEYGRERVRSALAWEYSERVLLAAYETVFTEMGRWRPGSSAP